MGWLGWRGPISHEAVGNSVALHATIIIGVRIATTGSLMVAITVSFSLKLRVILIMMCPVAKVVLERFLILRDELLLLDVIASVPEQHLGVLVVGTIGRQVGVSGHL